MNKPPSIIRELLLTLVVAIGIAATWSFVFVWLGAAVEQTAMSQHQIESLLMRQDGVPVITRYQPLAYPNNQQLFTLDGELAKGNSQQVVYPTFLQAKDSLATGSFSRMAGANDGGAPATYWYLLHDGRNNGRAYGVGYDAESKRIIGYFGRKGFAASQPPRDEWFPIDGDHALALATPSIISTEPSYGLPPVIYLLSAGELWSIDVRKKELQSLLKCPAAFTVGWSWQTLAELPPEVDDPGMVRWDAGYPRRKLAVRSPDHFTIVDPQSGEHADAPLPQAMQNQSCACFLRADGGFVLLATPQVPRSSLRPYEVAWLDGTGELERERQVEIAGATTILSSPGILPWVMAVAAPLPAASALFALGASAERWTVREFESFPAALSATLREFWPGFLLVVAVSLALAIAAYRRQRQYALPYAGLWAAFVFLLGVPGYLAYRFHRSWPVLEDCPRCGEASPRDRDRCSDCGATFPPPELKGLEIYA